MFHWLIEQFLGTIPTWIWPAISGAGAGTFFLMGILAHFPNIKPYEIIVKPIAAAVCVIGVFMFGGSGVTSIYQEDIKDMQNKLALAQQASDNATGQVQTKVVTLTKVIHDTKVVIQQQIVSNSAKIDAECKVDPAAIKDLNAASVNPNGATK
jgi:hypothetical protein